MPVPKGAFVPQGRARISNALPVHTTVSKMQWMPVHVSCVERASIACQDPSTLPSASQERLTLRQGETGVSSVMPGAFRTGQARRGASFVRWAKPTPGLERIAAMPVQLVDQGRMEMPPDWRNVCNARLEPSKTKWERLPAILVRMSQRPASTALRGRPLHCHVPKAFGVIRHRRQ